MAQQSQPLLTRFARASSQIATPHDSDADASVMFTAP